MTIEDLKAIAQRALERGIESIRESGELHMMFHLVGREKHEIVVAAGDVTNDEAAKQELSARLKARVREGDIEAVIMVSDTYIADVSREEDARLQAIRRAFGMTIEDCWKAGLIPKREAVSVTLESPIYAQVARQEYRRAEDDDKRVELVGAPVITSTVEDEKGISGKYRGRFMNWFPEAREGRA